MVNFDLSHIRRITKILVPTADFKSSFTFYYDETNNIRKFYVKEIDFNSCYYSNFVLGGLVYEGTQPDIKPLFNKLNLQKNIQEVKLKHIAKGDFINCLNSEKLNYFLTYLLESDLYIHYSSLNLLYWSIVDIIDSAIINSEVAKSLNPNYLKNDLYKLAKLEIKSVIKLFHKFDYPNIKQEYVLEFIEELSSIFDKYIYTEEFNFGLKSLKKILKEANKNASLPFIMDEEDHILINNFSHFYLRNIYLFQNSNHVFDNEGTISEIFDRYTNIENSKEIKNYSFVDSQDNLFIQASDIFVGLMGKLATYINTSSREKIVSNFDSLSNKQLNNLNCFINLMEKSNSKNIAFLHSMDSYEELIKLDLMRDLICEIRSY